MRLLDRYLLRELWIPFSYCLCGFFLFWLAFSLFGELEDLQRAELAFREVALLYLHRIPELLVVVLPVALLLAQLYALSGHARHNELAAARAAGLGLWRICAPHLATGALLSLALLAVNELWAAGRGMDAQALLALREGREPPSGPLSFSDRRSGRRWMVESFHRGSARLEGVHIEWELDSRSLDLLGKHGLGLPPGRRTFGQWPLEPGSRIDIKARSGRFAEGAWTFEDLEIWVRLPGPAGPRTLIHASYPVRSLPEFGELPRHLRTEDRIAGLDRTALAKEARVSLRDIADYRALNPLMPQARRAALDTQFHGRLAWPLTCLVVVLVSMPLAASGVRSSPMAGAAAGIGICLAYFLVMRAGLALGTGGALPPWLGAWLPNLLFGGGAVLRILALR